MPPKNSDLELLIKMLGMTGSDNDNTVLVAVRKANDQVRKLAGSWEQLLRGHFTIAADPFENLGAPPTTFKQAPSFNQPYAPPRPAPKPYSPPKPRRPARVDISNKPVKDILDTLGL
jgi:hypothetical protein